MSHTLRGEQMIKRSKKNVGSPSKKLEEKEKEKKKNRIAIGKPFEL